MARLFLIGGFGCRQNIHPGVAGRRTVDIRLVDHEKDLSRLVSITPTTGAATGPPKNREKDVRSSDDGE